MRVDFNDLLSAGFYAAYKLLTVVMRAIRRRAYDRHVQIGNQLESKDGREWLFYIPTPSTFPRYKVDPHIT